MLPSLRSFVRRAPALRALSSTNLRGLLPTLPFENGNFNSISLDVSTVTDDTADFGVHLMNSMLLAREEKKAAAWLKVRGAQW